MRLLHGSIASRMQSTTLRFGPRSGSQMLRPITVLLRAWIHSKGGSGLVVGAGAHENVAPVCLGLPPPNFWLANFWRGSESDYPSSPARLGVSPPSDVSP